MSVMVMASSKIYAVLTGDIIGSTRRGAVPLAQVRHALHEAVSAYQSAHRGVLVGALDMFRGDSWQLLIASPERALEVAIYLRASLHMATGMDTRIAMGIGPVQDIQEEAISQSTGDAFEVSGRQLDDRRAERSDLLIGSSPWVAQRHGDLKTVFGLCDALVSGWTPRQCEAVHFILLHPSATHSEIGDMLEDGVTQQAVSKHLKALHWDAVDQALAWFSNLRFDWADPGTQA